MLVSVFVRKKGSHDVVAQSVDWIQKVLVQCNSSRRDVGLIPSAAVGGGRKAEQHHQLQKYESCLGISSG